ncbi:type IV pilus modification protein PilV [Azotobacter beijerinckii]|nr:type IV pilus modification protein PilV [Azotobacter beijerinckii]
MQLMSGQSRNAGFTLIEILVALLIFMVSSLGIARLVTRTVQQESESYQRVQALVLLQDMQEKLGANRQAASCYASTATLGTGYDGTISCGTGSTAQRATAVADLQRWDSLLEGAAEKDGASNVGALIGARGCIRLVDAGERTYRITVAWQGLGDTVAPASDCGKDNYGSDAQRRTVSLLVRLGSLSS